MNVLASNEILFALWFFLPAGIANMAPIFAAHLPLLKRWDTPLDLHKKYRGKQITGPNKTFRGLLGGAVVGGVCALIQAYLWPEYSALIGLPNGSFWIFCFGALLGLGALLGDAVESFFKRQNNITSGKSWFPFDQTDYIVGGLIAASLTASIDILVYVLIFIIYFGLHIVVSYIGYLIGLKKAPI